MHLRFAVLVLLNKTTDPGAILYVQNGQIKLHKGYLRMYTVLQYLCSLKQKEHYINEFYIGQLRNAAG
jgi:hypothetical protein